MTRMLAFVAALLVSAIAVSSACVANDMVPPRFALGPPPPDSLRGLVGLGALKATPDLIGTLAPASFSNLEPSDLVQVRGFGCDILDR